MTTILGIMALLFAWIGASVAILVTLVIAGGTLLWIALCNGYPQIMGDV